MIEIILCLYTTQYVYSLQSVFILYTIQTTQAISHSISLDLEEIHANNLRSRNRTEEDVQCKCSYNL